jgi:hypothetical protein
MYLLLKLPSLLTLSQSLAHRSTERYLPRCAYLPFCFWIHEATWRPQEYGTRRAPATYQPFTVDPLRVLRRLDCAMQ